MAILIDENVVRSAAKYCSNGGWAHDLYQEIQTYQNFCKKGEEEKANKSKQKLQNMVLEARQQNITDMTTFENPAQCTWCGNGQDIIDLDDHCLNCGRNDKWRQGIRYY